MGEINGKTAAVIDMLRQARRAREETSTTIKVAAQKHAEAEEAVDRHRQALAQAEAARTTHEAALLDAMVRDDAIAAMLAAFGDMPDQQPEEDEPEPLFVSKAGAVVPCAPPLPVAELARNHVKAHPGRNFSVMELTTILVKNHAHLKTRQYKLIYDSVRHAFDTAPGFAKHESARGTTVYQYTPLIERAAHAVQ